MYDHIAQRKIAIYELDARLEVWLDEFVIVVLNFDQLVVDFFSLRQLNRDPAIELKHRQDCSNIVGRIVLMIVDETKTADEQTVGIVGVSFDHPVARLHQQGLVYKSSHKLSTVSSEWEVTNMRSILGS